MESKIFIIDDAQEIRDTLYLAFKSIKLDVETFEDAISFLKKYDAKQKGCIISDIRMPGMSGLVLLEELKKLKNRMPIIMISGCSDIPIAVKAMKLGALDFITKPFSSQHIVDLVQEIIKQDFYDSAYTHVKEIVLNNYSILTKREKDIMDFVAQGKLNKEISYELNIKVCTVEYHRARLMRKMNAKNVADLVQMKLMIA